jgi:hypothetical protein
MGDMELTRRGSLVQIQHRPLLYSGVLQVKRPSKAKAPVQTRGLCAATQVSRSNVRRDPDIEALGSLAADPRFAELEGYVSSLALIRALGAARYERPLGGTSLKSVSQSGRTRKEHGTMEASSTVA